MSLDIVVTGLGFPESPRWHDGELWFSDFQRRAVCVLGADGVVREIVTVDGQPSGLGWRPDGTLLIVSMLDRRLLAWDGEKLSDVADLSGVAPFWCNDMVVDRAGRAYVGNFGFDLYGGEAPTSTVLAMVDLDGTVSVAATDVVFPNGSVITPDGGTLIVGESFANRLTTFALAADGSLGERRVFADLGDAAPDGVSLDEEGGLWVASPRTRELLQVDPTGQIVRRIPTGERAPFACMLGGPDRRTLYVCLCEGHTKSGRGAIATFEVEVRGAGLP